MKRRTAVLTLLATLSLAAAGFAAVGGHTPATAGKASTTPPSPSHGGGNGPLPKLTTSAAKSYSGTALYRRLGRLNHVTETCSRESSTRVLCEISATEKGRARWSGSVVIWFSRDGKHVDWNYSLRLTGRPQGCAKRLCLQHVNVH